MNGLTWRKWLLSLAAAAVAAALPAGVRNWRHHGYAFPAEWTAADRAVSLALNGAWRKEDGAVSAGNGRAEPEGAASGAKPDVGRTSDSGAMRETGQESDSGTTYGRQPAEAGKLDLNRAGKAELLRLPGIGAARAESILRLRERLGRFRSVEDLQQVDGIGPKTLEALRPLVTAEP